MSPARTSGLGAGLGGWRAGPGPERERVRPSGRRGPDSVRGERWEGAGVERSGQMEEAGRDRGAWGSPQPNQ